MTGGSNTRVSLAALIAIKPGQPAPADLPRAPSRSRGKDRRKGFTEADYARLLDAAHQQLGGPLVVVWDNLNTHISAAMSELIAPGMADRLPAPRRMRTSSTRWSGPSSLAPPQLTAL